jgi:RNA polymerase sigma-70 factor (ECF subfamily)
MDALERLYRDTWVGFRNALTPIVGSTALAGEIVQEAFATALRARGQLRREESLPAWVWQIAYRAALRELGRPATVELPEDLTFLDPERDPELAAAIRTLPPQRRLVVFLRYFAGFSYDEIAEALGISEKTVSSTLTQARTALLKQLPREAAG